MVRGASRGTPLVISGVCHAGRPGGAHPDTIRAAVTAAFRGGAGGIVISREYEEMRLPHLQAVGDAVREMARTR